MISLKPCKTCGHDCAALLPKAVSTEHGLEFDGWFVRCMSCGEETSTYVSMGQAVSVWNKWASRNRRAE